MQQLAALGNYRLAAPQRETYSKPHPPIDLTIISSLPL